MIPDKAVEAARRELAKGAYQMRPDELPYADAARRALEAAIPFLADAARQPQRNSPTVWPDIPKAQS